jgi:hypothetical protein
VAVEGGPSPLVQVRAQDRFSIATKHEMKKSIRSPSDAPTNEFEVGWRSLNGLCGCLAGGVQPVNRIHERSIKV